jgi:hypothetical protein
VLCDMPHWMTLFGIVVGGWLVLAVVGGWLVGRGLGAIERHQTRDPDQRPDGSRPADDLRRAA